MPTPKRLGAQSAGKPDFEIIPDSEFIVFHGSEHETGEVELAGNVVLNTVESLSFKTVKVVLEGKRKISWTLNSVTGAETSEKKTFYHEEKVLTPDSSGSGVHKLHRGQHAFPFKFLLSGAMPESVEGMNNAWIVYTLHARMERGYLAKDFAASQHIRIIRTMGQDELEMVQSRTNSDIWSNKISYNISIPSDAYVFGTAVTADVELTPIRKGLTMGKIELQLLEKSTFKIFADELVSSGQQPIHMTTSEKEVARVDMEFPEESKQLISTSDPDALMDEMYKFPVHLQLPRSLRNCRQNVKTERIKIEHIWRLRVNLHNPEGHVSQLVCKIPIKLFVSPNLPINANQDVCSAPNQVADAVINQQETTLVAPPEYGAHLLDQLYNDIDPSGFRTPLPVGIARSGTTTPFYGHSQPGSTENIASLAQAVGESTSRANDGIAGGVSAIAVHSRLSNLQEQVARPRPRFSGHSSQTHTLATSGSGPDYFSHSSGRNSRHSPSHSQPLSRTTSDEQETTVPGASGVYNLSRVPSYNTAVHTPRPENPIDNSLPTYEVATSRPPTPEPQRPGQVHLRNGPGSGSNLQDMTLMEEDS